MNLAVYLLVLAGYHLSGRVSGSGEKIYKPGKYIIDSVNIETTLHTQGQHLVTLNVILQILMKL